MWVKGVRIMGITITLMMMMLMMSNLILVKITIIIKQIRVRLAAHVGGGGAYHGYPAPYHLDDDDEQLHPGEDHDYNQQIGVRSSVVCAGSVSIRVGSGSWLLCRVLR